MARSFDFVRILLTGASGFAGAHMLKLILAENKHQVFCPVTYKHGGNPKRIPAVLGDHNNSLFELFNMDLAHNQSLNQLSNLDLDIIINFASESHVDRSIENPLNFFHNNINLMINLLETSRMNKIKHFIHISTDEVYGSLPRNSINIEGQFPHSPSNPYSASKAAQESLAAAYSKTFKVPITIMNSTNLIGEAQNQEKFLPKIISSIIKKKKIFVDTNDLGEIGSRKYVYAGDLAKAVLTVINLPLKFSNIPNKFHVSGREEFSNLEMVNLVGKLLDTKPVTSIRTSPRPGYDTRYELSSEKLRSLGWNESDNIENHVDKILKWTISHPDWLTIDY